MSATELLGNLAREYFHTALTMLNYFLVPVTGAGAKYVGAIAVAAIVMLMLRIYLGGILGYLIRYAAYLGIYWLIVHFPPYMALFQPSPPLHLPKGLVPASQQFVSALLNHEYAAYVVAFYFIAGLWLPVTIIGFILRRRRLSRLRDAADMPLPVVADGAPTAAGAAGQPFEVRRREGEKKQTMVIMMTDIKGYSARMEKDEAATFELLKEHNVIMRRAITTNRGKEIKTIGDAFMVVFTSPIDAVRCGMAMQKGLHDFNKPRAVNDHLLVRIGVHQGEVIVTGKDVFGEGVNIAARMESITDPGGMSISKDVYEAIKGKIEAGYQSVGTPKMKNIANPPEVFKVHMNFA